jgi:hypothetical protein
MKNAMKQEQGEPVAWRTYTGRGYYIINPTFEEAQKNWPDRTHQPLYTTPQQRKPLTDEAIATVYWGATGQSLRPQDNVLAHKFARAIEDAHGIKE